jgi:hypothetical protein
MRQTGNARSTVADLVALAGVGLALYGLWRWYEPLAWIAGGLLLVIIAVALLRR